MELSVIVPIYNIEKYIAQCVESILAQTFSGFECILVDDGSSDHSGKICDLYTQRDCRVKVIHKENEGLVSARKTGFMASKGEYIAFIDGDDWVEPDMFQKLMREMKKNNARNDLVICGYYEDFPDRKVKRDGISKRIGAMTDEGKCTSPKMINEQFFFDFLYRPNMWGKIFIREKLEQNLMKVNEKISMGEDVAVTFPYIHTCKNIGYVPEYLYHYRQRRSSMVHAYDERLSSKIKILLAYMKENSFIEGFSGSNQLLLFSYYLVVFAFRNEALKDKFKDTYQGVKKLYADEDFMNIVGKVRLPNARFHHKLFYASLTRGGVLTTTMIIRVWRHLYAL